MILLRFRPECHYPIVVDAHMNDIGIAANGAIFDVTLQNPLAQIQRNHYLLPTRVAHITSLLVRTCDRPRRLIPLRQYLPRLKQLASPPHGRERIAIRQPMVATYLDQIIIR